MQNTTRAQRMNVYLAALVEMPTISDDFAANHIAIDYLVDFFETRGLMVKRFEWDQHEALVATTRDTKTPAVMLGAHLDVIPASSTMYKLRHEGNKLIGRGVYDMKGAIAAYMEFVDSNQANLADYDFGVMITTDEELGGRDGVNGVDKLVNLGYLPKMCVLPDGGQGWQMETAAKGYLHFTLEAHGVSGHGSRPWLGDNAAYKLIDAIQALRDYYKDQTPQSRSLNVGVIEGGQAPNKVPDFMRAEIDTRPISEAELEELLAVIPRICEEHGVTARHRATIHTVHNSLENPWLAEFAASIKKITGVTCEGFTSPAGSDARFLTPAGVPCAVFYPVGGGHHSESEWVDETAFHQMADVVEDYVLRMAKTPVDNKVSTQPVL